MQLIRNTALVLFILTSSSTTPLLADTTKGDLLIKVTGAKTSKGKLIVYVYRKQDNIFKSNPYLIEKSEIYSGAGTVSFKNLPFERYSIMAFHDINNNSIMDHNFMKLPTEAFGFSNNWNLSLLSGKPTFKKTSVSFNEGQTEIQVEVK
ncbi:MAG: DUF2141 domain-containing protein [Methylococcales bacterium]|nr:DUF2141 domain-containing protein [Methylococcales bacterium]